MRMLSMLALYRSKTLDVVGTGMRIVLVSVLAANSIPAQVTLFEFSSSSGSDTGYGSAVALIGDLDGDRFGEILIGSPRDDSSGTDAGMIEIRSGRNGSVLRRHYGDRPGQELGTLAIGLGDADGDGVPDYAASYPYALTSVGQGVVRVWSGRTGAEIWAIIDGMQNFATYLAPAGDLDGDGRADLIVGSNAEQRIFRGAGGLLLASLPGPPCTGILDTDGNGVMEYATYTHDTPGPGGLVRAYELSGSLRWQQRWRYFSPYVRSIQACGDINRDGLPDILIGNPHSPSSSNQRGGYAVLGMAGIYLDSSGTSTGNETRSILLSAGGDFDADGWPDFVEAYRKDIYLGLIPNGARVVSGRTRTFLYDFRLWGIGEVRAVAGPAQVSSGPYRSIAVGWRRGITERVTVISGGDVETVGLGCGAAFEPPRLTIDPLVTGGISRAQTWRSSGGVGALLVSNPLAVPMQGFGCDLFFDPSAYLVVGSGGQRPTFAKWTEQPGALASDRLLSGDVDGDGMVDLVRFAPHSGSWTLARSNGHRFLPHGPATLTGHGSSSTRSFLADVDGDRRADAIVTDPTTGDWYVARSLSGTFSTPTALVRGFVPGQPEQLVGDVNGDRRADIVTWNGGPYAAWYVGLSTGTSVTAPAIWAYHGVGATWLALADVNGDDRDDAIAYYAATGRWSVRLSTGNAFAPGVDWIAGGHGTSATQQMLADVDADGRSDAIVVSGGDWLVALSTGSSFAAPTAWGIGFVPTANQRLAGDANGDGAADAILGELIGGTAQIHLAPSIASPALGSLSVRNFMYPGWSGWHLDVLVPPIPSFIGLQLAFQSVHLPSAAPGGLDFSNGAYGVIR